MGFFVAFEGIDGCGKSTQVNLVHEELTRRAVSIPQRLPTHIVTREPGGTTIGEKIRSILLSPDNSLMCNDCEVLLYLAARAQHVSQIIMPALKQDKIVLCDRFIESTFAYQGYGRGLSLRMLEDLNSYATGGLVPDLTFVFDIDYETSRIRMATKQLDRLENNDSEFFKRIRSSFVNSVFANSNRMVLLAGQKSIDELFTLVMKTIDFHKERKDNE
jgi:dTMP kinase